MRIVSRYVVMQSHYDLMTSAERVREPDADANAKMRYAGKQPS